MRERPAVTEYGKTLIRAATAEVGKLRAAEVGGCFRSANVPQGECADGDCYCYRQCEREARAALLAFLDKLIESGPSEGMQAAAFREMRCHVHDLDWAEDTFGKAFTAMLKALRSEIAEESGR